MKNRVYHIYSSDAEIDEIFNEAVRSLDRALELFTMISHQDSCAKIMAKKTYKLFLDGEKAQQGVTPDE